MTHRLKQFLDDALDEKNVIMNKILNDPYYKQQIEVMVKDMTFTKQSFEPNMKEIASLVLKRSTNDRYVIPLLLFGYIWTSIIQPLVSGSEEPCW